METNHSNNPVTDFLSLTIASPCQIFSMEEVESKKDKLDMDNRNLRRVYERMLHYGPDRFHVKPSALPTISHLYEGMPNFSKVLDEIQGSIALSLAGDSGLEIPPILLLGTPGTGKTLFSERIAALLNTSINVISLGTSTAGWLMSGSSSQWNGAKVGKVFETLVDGKYANPVLVVDEIDKASKHAQYDPMGAFYSLLERHTAKNFTDEFADVAIDASKVIWIATANDERDIPEPILSRLDIFEIRNPAKDEVRMIARSTYISVRTDHTWGKLFCDEPPDDVLDIIGQIPPREMRKVWEKAFKRAVLARRDTLKVEDIPSMQEKKVGIGFLN